MEPMKRIQLVKMFRLKHGTNKLVSQKALIVTLLLLLSACKTPGVFTEAPDTPSNIERLSILPFSDMAKVYGVNANVKCPVCGNFIMAGEVAEDAADFLTDHLFSVLQNNSDA